MKVSGNRYPCAGDGLNQNGWKVAWLFNLNFLYIHNLLKSLQTEMFPNVPNTKFQKAQIFEEIWNEPPRDALV